MIENIERRFAEFRFDDSGEDGPVLRGYAAVFDSDSVFMGFTERISQGAFTRTLAESNDVKALVEHETSNIIARTGNDSLTLREDDHGLYVEIRPNQSSTAQDLVENIRTGLLDSMSFGFHVVKDSWERSEGQNIRTLLDVDLIEVSVVATPAYQASEIALRDLESAWSSSADVVERKYEDIDFTPPEGAREEAERGLEWREEFGRGGTEVGVARARDISNGESLSPETIKRMVSFFARHEVDKEAEGFESGEDGYPSAGRIAWALWGGDPGQTWANAIAERMDKEDGVDVEEAAYEEDEDKKKKKRDDHINVLLQKLDLLDREI